MSARDVIAQALELSEAATDGPWERESHDSAFVRIRYRPHVTAVPYAGTVGNAAFIAAARTLLPALAKALGDVLDVFDDQAVEGFSDTTSAVRIYRAITAALSEVTP